MYCEGSAPAQLARPQAGGSGDRPILHTPTSNQATLSALPEFLGEARSRDRISETRYTFKPTNASPVDVSPSQLPVSSTLKPVLHNSTSLQSLATSEVNKEGRASFAFHASSYTRGSSIPNNIGELTQPLSGEQLRLGPIAANMFQSRPSSIASQRVESWPYENRHIRVKVITTLEGIKKCDEYDIQVDESAQDNYKQIECTSKSIFEEAVSCPEGKEVSLWSGFYEFSCSDACEQCRLCRKPEFFPEKLERWEDWADIRTLVKNLLEAHMDLKITVRRNLDFTNIPVTQHDPRPLTVTAKDWLYTKLHDAKRSLTDNQSVTYIPNDSIQKLTSKEIVFAVVQSANEIPKERREEFQRKAYDAHILFAIYVRHDLSLRLLQEALENGISNNSLPLSNEDPDWLRDLARRKDLISWHENVVKGQWEFLAATFDRSDNEEDREFSPDKIIPYRSKEKCGDGAFSRVYSILLEQSHQRIYSLPDVSCPCTDSCDQPDHCIEPESKTCIEDH